MSSYCNEESTDAGGRAKTLIYAGQVGLLPEGSLRMLKKPWPLTADLGVPPPGAEGIIAIQSGIVDGYRLYLHEGKPTFELK